MRTIDVNTFVNSFKIKPDKSMSFLLGAGASVSSNIPSGGQMVWDFKRTLYCTANRFGQVCMVICLRKMYRKRYNHILMVKMDIRNCGQQKNIRFILKNVIHQEVIESIIFGIKCET